MNTRREASLTERDLCRVARPNARVPLELARAHGCTLTDVHGRNYLDLSSGWNVANAGWGNARIVGRVNDALGRLPYAPCWCTFEEKVELAEAMSAALGGEWKSYCCVSGSEAIESAVKIAKRATGRLGLVSIAESYHGSTLGAMLAGGMPGLHGKDLPPSGAYRHVPIPDPLRTDLVALLPQIRSAILQEPVAAAVLLEPVFTNQGAIVPDARFFDEIARQCRSRGALLIVDEVGTGFARTGELFAYQHFGLQPDIIAVGKAFSSGTYPLAAALLRADLAHAVSGPGFNSTYGWTPPGCAAGLEMLRVIEEEDLCAQAETKGKALRSQLTTGLRGNPFVAAVRGPGLEVGVELVERGNAPLPKAAVETILQRLREAGLFIEASAYTSSLLLMPPLVISERDLDGAAQRLIEVLNVWAAGQFKAGAPLYSETTDSLIL